MRKLYCYALCIFLLFYFNHSQAQCVINSVPLNRSAMPLKGSKFVQNFTATCDGSLTQLAIQLYYSNDTRFFQNINIVIYEGESPTDLNSKLLYQLENYTPTFSNTVLNIPSCVSVEKGKKYYFIVTNSQAGNNLPDGLRYNSSLNNSYPGGFAFYTFNQWQYQQDYESKKGVDILYTATITPAIIETHSICKGNVLQIFNYDSTNSTYKNSDTGVFKLDVKGDTAVVTALNYGMASFIYTKKNAPNQQYKYELAVTMNTSPSITASKQVLASLTDTVMLTAESNTNTVLNFDGNTYLTVPDNNRFQFSSGFTVEAWVLCNDVRNTQYLFFKGSGPNACGIYIAKGKIVFETGDNMGHLSSFSSYTSFSSGKWAHIAVTYDGSNVIIYLNGEQVSVNSYTSPIINNQEDILIGLYTNRNSYAPLGYFDNQFKGQMDEFRLWNVCRTEDEIKSNYRKAILRYSKGLVAYYNFDYMSKSNAGIDVSINHNNAYINYCKANVTGGNVWIQGILDIQKHTYLWSNNATRQSIIVTNPDNYSYKLTDLTTGCITQSQEIQITAQNK